MRRFTIVGTDTCVGKTFVTAGLIRAAVRAGYVAFGLKPVESGATGASSSDTAVLANVSGRTAKETNFIQFGPAVAPGLVPGNSTEIAELVNFVQVRCNVADSTQQDGAAGPPPTLCFVETAGGWFSPLSSHGDVREFAVMLAAPVLIVGHAGLGAINQLRLTVSAVKASQLPIVALILSQRASDDDALAAQNESAIAQRTGLTTMRFRSDADADLLIARIQEDRSWGW